MMTLSRPVGYYSSNLPPNRVNWKWTDNIGHYTPLSNSTITYVTAKPLHLYQNHACNKILLVNSTVFVCSSVICPVIVALL